MGTNMYFTKRDEILFIEYAEVIKSPTLFMLKLIRGPLKEVYRDFIHVEFLETMTDEELEIYLLRRKHKNIFFDLAKREFDYDTAYQNLYDKYDNMYDRSPLLKIGTTIDFLSGQKFNKKIYLYSKTYDPRIELDIKYSFRDWSKIEYVYGDIATVLENISPVTTFILNDIWLIPELCNLDKIKMTDVLSTNYRYNLTYNEEAKEFEPCLLVEKYAMDYVFKFGLFAPINLKETHQPYLEKSIIKYFNNNI